MHRLVLYRIQYVLCVCADAGIRSIAARRVAVPHQASHSTSYGTSGESTEPCSSLVHGSISSGASGESPEQCFSLVHGSISSGTSGESPEQCSSLVHGSISSGTFGESPEQYSSLVHNSIASASRPELLTCLL